MMSAVGESADEAAASAKGAAEVVPPRYLSEVVAIGLALVPQWFHSARRLTPATVPRRAQARRQVRGADQS